MLLAIKAAVGIGLAVVFGAMLWALVPDLHVGNPRILDGDTLALEEERIRLSGIDAPELEQQCGRAGKQWRCGAAASEMLGKRIGEGSVLCLGNGRDAYKRVLARCYTVRGDLGRYLVEQGLAVTTGAHGSRYEAVQAVAIKNLKGIWRGPFEFPRQWRERQRLVKN